MITLLVNIQIQDLNSDILNSKNYILSTAPPISFHLYDSSQSQIFALLRSPHLILTTATEMSRTHYTHFADEETEA